MKLSNSYLIVVPTTLFDQIAAADLVDAVRAEVKRALAAAFGGYTETESVGGYVTAAGASNRMSSPRALIVILPPPAGTRPTANTMFPDLG